MQQRGSDFGQRHQREATFCQARVRHAQHRLGDDCISIKEDIYVEGAAAPALAPLTARPLLRGETLCQQLLGRQGGAQRQGLVQESGLAFAAPGGGFLEC